jgi:hypothetical protein
MFQIPHIGRAAAGLLLTAWCLRAQPAPDAPASGPAPGSAARGDTIQLHRVVYVHQSSSDNENLLQKRHFVDQYAAPKNIFDAGADAMPTIKPPPVVEISPALLQRERQQADRQKNWMLMTPEEILGVDNQDQKKDDPYGADRNLSLEERYLKRSMMRYSGTNESDQESILKKRDFLNPDENDTDAFGQRMHNPANNNRWTDGGLRGLMSGNRSGNEASDREVQTPNAWVTSIWGQAPTEDPAQAKLKYQQDMQQFDQMLTPPARPAAEAKVSSLGEPVPAMTFANPLQLQEQARPHAAVSAAETFTQMRENIGHPTMPSLYAPATVHENRRKPSPPPWTVSPGQLGLGQ